MAAQATNAVTFNGAQRELYEAFAATIRQGLVDATAANDAKMQATIDERIASLDARLQEQSDLLDAAIAEDQAQMKALLKEIYSYNSYDVEAAKKSNGTAAPYNHEQHQAFLHKFAFYLKDQLRGLDAARQNANDSWTAQAATAVEAAVDQNDDL